MALNLKNVHVERLVDEVAALTGESKTEAVRRALEERRERLTFQVVRRDRGAEAQRFLAAEIWPEIPPELVGVGVSKEEQERLLGLWPEVAS